MFLKELFCKHEYSQIGRPYIVFGGRTKFCKVHCEKCNTETILDIFSKKFKKVKREFK